MSSRELKPLPAFPSVLKSGVATNEISVLCHCSLLCAYWKWSIAARDRRGEWHWGTGMGAQILAVLLCSGAGIQAWIVQQLSWLCSGYLACGAFLSCWSEELRDEKKKKILCENEMSFSHCFHMKTVNHHAYPAPRTEYDVIFCRRTCHTIVISSSSNKTTTSLLFSRFRKELSSKNVCLWICFLPWQYFPVQRCDSFEDILRLGIWFLLQMTLQTFSARNLPSKYPTAFYSST